MQGNPTEPTEQDELQATAESRPRRYPGHTRGSIALLIFIVVVDLLLLTIIGSGVLIIGIIVGSAFPAQRPDDMSPAGPIAIAWGIISVVLMMVATVYSGRNLTRPGLVIALMLGTLLAVPLLGFITIAIGLAPAP